ncbi:hypothetical protein MKW94_008926 [Papaver nudicaule]|uniref:Uncharacterized protein n=1 Tax=Papaver nudicaule TaxID=74823 RepID=A0AA41SBS8_PAPNU|nr:hypothetical protein [Papaver nudicaule]
MILARLCDYAAAMEILRQKSETCGSPDDWECFLNDLGRLLEHDSQWCGATTDNLIHPPLVLACKLSQLSDYEFMHSQFGTTLSEALTLKLANLPMEIHGCLTGKEYDGLDEDANEYFNRLGAEAKVSLHISRKSEELQLIKYFCEQDTLTPALLREEVEKFLARVEESSGFIHDGVSSYHGTSIALRTNRFIILAADGKLTTKNNSNGLHMEDDKIWGFDDMGVGICGSWKTLSNTVSMLKRRFKLFKDNGTKRPTVGKLVDSLKEKLSSCKGKTGIILGAFDQLEGGGFVPCISFADEHRRIDINESFFCLGTGARHASKVLSGGKVHMEMSLEEAINLVERALLYASVRDSCTGGYASIYVIEVGKSARAIPRERICTTLWRRHHLSLPGHHLTKQVY